MRLALLAALFLLPLAGAQEGDPLCIIFIEPDDDWAMVRMRADLILDDAERANITRDVDSNADGTLTPVEVDAYEASRKREYTSISEMESRLLYLDGAIARSLSIRVDLANWTGPAESARNGKVTELREYDMGPRGYDWTHVLSGGLGAHPYVIPRPVVEVVVINAPEGWAVRSVSQEPARNASANDTTPVSPNSHPTGNLFLGQERSATVRGFDLSSAYTIVLQDDDPEQQGSPGFGALATVAALCVMAIASRRRARR